MNNWVWFTFMKITHAPDKNEQPRQDQKLKNIYQVNNEIVEDLQKYTMLYRQYGNNYRGLPNSKD